MYKLIYLNIHGVVHGYVFNDFTEVHNAVNSSIISWCKLPYLVLNINTNKVIEYGYITNNLGTIHNSSIKGKKFNIPEWLEHQKQLLAIRELNRKLDKGETNGFN